MLSATTGALASLITNMLNQGKIDKHEFLKYLECQGGSEDEAIHIWTYLKKNGYIEKR